MAEVDGIAPTLTGSEPVGPLLSETSNNEYLSYWTLAEELGIEPRPPPSEGYKVLETSRAPYTTPH